MNNYIEQGHSNYPNKLYRGKSFELKTKGIKPQITDYRRPGPAANPAFENLPQNLFLGEKNRELFSELLPYLETVTFTGRESIYQTGEKIDYVYFPQSAIFSESLILEDGASIEIAMTGRESIVGVTSILDNTPAANWTQISAAGNAFKLESRILREAASFNLDLQRILYGCVNSYIKQISQRSVCSSFHSLEKRFCSWLLMMRNRFKDMRMPLTQEQMAHALGANRPSISHIAHALRAAEIIDYRRGSLVIRSRPKLENRACRCFAEIDCNPENIF